jgi:thiol-disulfide isomerase/thioredoxin
MVNNTSYLFLFLSIFLSLTKVRSSAAFQMTPLNDSTVETYFKKNKIALVKFYAPWCYHCVRFQSEANRIAETIERKSKKVSFAAVDITNNSKLASQFEVRGIPSLYYIQNGKVWKYEGNLNHDSVVDFVENSRNYPYMPSWKSPLGPMGTVRGYLGSLRSSFFSILPWFVAHYGVSRWAAFFILVVGFAIVILVITALSVYFSVKSSSKIKHH